MELHRVLLDGGEEDVSIARGLWDKEEALLIRWNGREDQKNGFPARFENMTWMVLPRWLEAAVLHAMADRVAKDLVENNSDVPAGGAK
ncbi:hypothetical protein [Rhizobium sp. C1]|uniref:hypothetical protein n=1 Tax=Rhizobium sp. C1 TaxID=1349799 RepID=UPI001E3886B6|nr:hypothetical protein [Rhizobium sp. C1]MCD2179919.1 hypothetical protein [Rhizobium sp. C1]